MKITSVILLITAIAIWFFYDIKKYPENNINKSVAADLFTSNPLIMPLRALSKNKTPIILTDVEAELQKYKNLNYGDFNQEDLQIYNQLVLQRAIILKKQIFNKAAKMGYYL